MNPSSSSKNNHRITRSSSSAETQERPPPKKDVWFPRVRGKLRQHILHSTTIKTFTEYCGELLELMDQDFFSFTPEEDQLLRDNWKKCAKNFKFTGSIFEHLGYDKHGINLKEVAKANDKAPYDIWPLLCDGLPYRFAPLIRDRILYLFHPYYDPNEDYDLSDIEWRVKKNESLQEISEITKIPPTYIKMKFFGDRNTAWVDPKMHILTLKMLYESVVDNPESMNYAYANFDWDKFRKKCLQQSFDPPSPTIVYNTFRRKFYHAEKTVFKFLNPPSSLKNKLVFYHEAYVRYCLENKRGRGNKPMCTPNILFTVVFEYYNKDTVWNPPPELEKYAVKVDLNLARERIRQVKERRKRIQETPESSKHVIVSKRIKREDVDEHERSLIARRTRRSREPDDEQEDDNEVDISSIHGDSTIDSTALEDPNQSEIFSRADESAVLRMDTSTLPNSPAKEKPKKSFVIDESKDIWLQLLSEKS